MSKGESKSIIKLYKGIFGRINSGWKSLLYPIEVDIEEMTPAEVKHARQYNTVFWCIFGTLALLAVVFSFPSIGKMIIGPVLTLFLLMLFSALSHNVLENGRSLLRMMPGKDDSLKLANLRLTFAYLMMHPGKKLICQGQDFGQKSRKSASEGVAWGELENEEQKNMRNFSRALLKFYREQPALYRLDEDADGFEWISNLDWERNLLVFLRKTENKKDTLLVVANFSNVMYDNFMVGVPYPGKYKEIFNSDDGTFGGSGVTNPRVKLSRAVEQDERKDSIKIKVPPLGVSVFRFTEAFEHTTGGKKENVAESARPRKRTAVKSLPDPMREQ